MTKTYRALPFLLFGLALLLFGCAASSDQYLDRLERYVERLETLEARVSADRYSAFEFFKHLVAECSDLNAYGGTIRSKKVPLNDQARYERLKQRVLFAIRNNHNRDAQEVLTPNYPW